MDSSVARAAELKNRYYSLLYMEMAERKRAEESLRLSNQLLSALSQAQLQFVAGTDLGVIFQDLLENLVATTDSSQGLIRLTSVDTVDHATSWSAVAPTTTRPIPVEQLAVMADEALAVRQAVFSAPQPVAAAAVHLVSVPIGCSGSAEPVLGVVVLARPAREYPAGVATLLEPLTTTCAQLLVAQRNEQQRRAAECALAEERALLAERVTQRTAELQLSNAELARAARAKDEFLATMNHELRTPLNAMMLYAESLMAQAAGPLNPRQQRAAKGIRESADHLLMLINDILDVAKIEAGHGVLEIAPIAVESACQSSLRLIAEQANKKSIQVTYERDPAVTIMDVDERRLKQILVNLLTNAVKFTPEGGAIGLQIEGDRHQNAVRLRVWDTGIGIDPADLPKLFKPFVQLDHGHTRQHGGTGLGLMLVYRMVEMHMGSVAVESAVGQGSRFIVTLPWQRTMTRSPSLPLKPSSLEPSSAQNNYPTVAAPTGGSTPYRAEPRILLAEDNEANIDALSFCLARDACQVIVARTGRDAIQAAKLHRPDLILMDVQMPELDGLEAMRALRNDPDMRRTPMIALTALAMPGDRERCLAAGANDYMIKPIQPWLLIEAIHRLLACDVPPDAQPAACCPVTAETEDMS